MTAAAPAWREVAPMNYPRSYHTLTVLPDGNVLATGGADHDRRRRRATGVLGTEIWNPDTDTWTRRRRISAPRLYHSSALLLPDGRVLLAGGGALRQRARTRTTPRSTRRPTCSRARGRRSRAPRPCSAYGQTFNVTTPDAAQHRSVSLVRMGSVTHNFDMDQRFMTLTFARRQAGSVTVDGPANAERGAARLLHASS